jgi:hypothetical protein
MYQPYPSYQPYQPYPSGQPTRPLRPPAPVPVRTAVKFMYAGAAIVAVNLVSVLVFTLGDIGGLKATLEATLRKQHPDFTAAQLSHLYTVAQIMAIVLLVAEIALWLWMARANGRGRNWARILSTVLFGLATLNLINVFRAVTLAGFGLGIVTNVLTWLVGLAAVWLLWRPASSAFFKPQGFTRAGPGFPMRTGHV